MVHKQLEEEKKQNQKPCEEVELSPTLAEMNEQYKAHKREIEQYPDKYFQNKSAIEQGLTNFKFEKNALRAVSKRSLKILDKAEKLEEIRLEKEKVERLKKEA